MSHLIFFVKHKSQANGYLADSVIVVEVAHLCDGSTVCCLFLLGLPCLQRVPDPAGIITDVLE
jgi:hypothetical protein